MQMQIWMEVALRSLAGFAILLFSVKAFVRRPAGESSAMEASITMGIALILAFGSFQLNIPYMVPVTAALIWGLLMFGVTELNMKSAGFRSFINGKGIPVIKDGKVLEDNMKKERLTTDELLMKLRSKNVFQYADVEFAVLEANGELNVLPKKEHQPVTAKILDKQVAPGKEPETVIMDGKILDEPLATRGLNRDWLHSELAKMNADEGSVFLGQVDEYGQLHIDLYDDIKQVPEPVELPLLEAAIKKVQADLELFALDTENPDAKKLYNWAAGEMNRVNGLVAPHSKKQ